MIKKQDTQKEIDKRGVAIRVEKVSKVFSIPHEKRDNLRGAAINMFKKNSYETFHALEDISFEIKKGEFFAIIGRNGSGKSTLLKMLARIYVPTSGKIELKGKLSPFLELGVGFNPELTGRENIFLGGTILGLKRQQIEEKYDKIVNFSELEEFIDMKLKNYSSGMQVRLAFSLAINVHAEILLMDEVLAVGDANFQSKCLKEFEKLRRAGKTVVLVSHDTNTVERFCDRVMYIDNSKVQMIGPPNKVVPEYLKKMSNERLSSGGLRSKRIVSNDAVIEKTQVLNDKAKEEEIITSGTKFTVRVNYKFYKNVNNPIFGVIIYDFKKNPVFITNTLFKKVKTGKFKKDDNVYVDFIIENYFASGEYTISPAIADQHGTTFYDWQDESAKAFIINENYSSGGIADFDHTINIRKQK